MHKWLNYFVRCTDGKMHYRGSSVLDSILDNDMEPIGQSFSLDIPNWIKDSCLETGGHSLEEWHSTMNAFERKLDQWSNTT